MSLIRKAFKRLYYPTDIMAQCFRWYLVYALSLRNLEEMMAERGFEVDTLNPTSLGAPISPVIRQRLSSAQTPSWSALAYG